MKNILAIILTMFSFSSLNAQKVYSLDVSHVAETPDSGYFKMGNPGPTGKAIKFNSRYMTIGGSPVLPIMGEMHFSRTKKDLWEDRILKMKACGVNIIATYLFWNQHEEIEGQFDWEQEKDIRSFIKLCQKHDLYVLLRIGPWSHGEARNGGTPDWLLQKQYVKIRSNDVVYQTYVSRYFHEIANQIKGLLYKDGGNIIGIQLENEYWYAKKGEAHIQWLKNLAVKEGFDVPFYTVTGWGDGSVPPFEVIPMWGAYADSPWVEHVTKEVLPYNFEYTSFRDNKHIGNNQEQHEKKYMSYEKYPFFTCEMGVGVQNTYHRRLCINPLDGLGMIVARLGSGSNLLGYYIFTGATQFSGKLWSTEEEQEKTGSWSRVPVKSYDFLAARRDSGALSDAYRKLKKLHYIVNEYEHILAPMTPVFPSGEKKDGFQWAVRSDNDKGFLFGINYCRYIKKQAQHNVKFKIKFRNKVLEFPKKGIDIPDSTVFVWPLGLNINGVELNYSTAQLIGTVDNCAIFFQNNHIPIEFSLDKKSVMKVYATSGTVHEEGDCWTVNDLVPGENCKIQLTKNDGTSETFFVLTEKESDDIWLLNDKGTRTCYLSEAGLYDNQGDVYITSTKPECTYSILTTGDEASFNQRNMSFKTKDVPVKIRKHQLMDGAQWIETSNFDTLEAYKQRYHRFILKEFSLDDPSGISQAVLYIYPESRCSINLNDNWVRQEIVANKLNEIDLTGYVKKNYNKMYLDFPYTLGKKKMSARLIVRYDNHNQFNCLSDSSWLVMDSYTNPTPNIKSPQFSKPTLLDDASLLKSISSNKFQEWDVKVPVDALENINNIYLKLDYTGDRAELYNDYMLSADDYNSHVTWTIGLNRQEHSVEGRNLRLFIYPLDKDEKIFIDKPAIWGSDADADLKKAKVEVEYMNQIK